MRLPADVGLPPTPVHGAALRKRLAPATLSNATQPSAAAPPTTSLNYGAHCAVRWAGVRIGGWGLMRQI